MNWWQTLLNLFSSASKAKAEETKPVVVLPPTPVVVAPIPEIKKIEPIVVAKPIDPPPPPPEAKKVVVTQPPVTPPPPPPPPPKIDFSGDPTKVDRDLSKLYPPFKREIDKVLEECHKQKLMVYVFEGFRSMERQDLLYAQGRTAPGAVVTNAKAGSSLHNYGLAVDLVFDGDPVRAGYQWTWSGNYDAMGKTVLKHPKLVWAGTWTKMREFPHVELKIPYTPSQLKKLYDSKKDLEALWKTLDKELGL